MESLAAAGVANVDLREGVHEHNRRLGCEFRRDGTVHLYSSTLRGLCAKLFFAATQAVHAGGRYTREELQLNRASRAWSGFLLARSKTLRTASGSVAEIRRVA